MGSKTVRHANGSGGVRLAERRAATIDLAADWGDSRRLLVRQDDTTVFACSATRRGPQTWFITDCLPRRRDPDLADVLLQVCDRLAAEQGATRMILITPASWEQRLAAAGASLLQRIIAMRLSLDEDILLMRGTPLSRAFRFAVLDAPGVDPVALSQLAAEAEREDETTLWRGIFSGDHGPLIPSASLRIVDGQGICAAIAVTEYRGTPLVSHLVVAEGERGGGLGRALLVESMCRLAQAGYVDCHLNVVEDNWVAHRLYRSTGFSQVEPTLRASHLSREPASDARR